MSRLLQAFYLILKALNFWFFIIPGKIPLLAFIGYFFIIDWSVGDQPIYLFNRQLGGVNSWGHFFFWIGLGFPFLWSFSYIWAATKNGVNNSNTSALDAAIKFRNGQMNVTTPQKAFEILKDTSSLDLMKANEGNKTFESALQGFNSKYGTKPPPEVFKGLTNKD